MNLTVTEGLVLGLAGAGVLLVKGKEAWEHRDQILGRTKIKHAEAMAALKERFPRAVASA